MMVRASRVLILKVCVGQVMRTRRELVAIGAAAAASLGFEKRGLSQTSNLPRLSLSVEEIDWGTSLDARRFDEYRICFAKGLEHQPDGYPEQEVFTRFFLAVRNRDLNALERLNVAVPWVDPTAGAKVVDAQIVGRHAEPWFDTYLMLGDIAELFWASLCRDVPFASYDESEVVQSARENLHQTDSRRFGRLFQISLPGIGSGGYVSQFLMKPVPLNGSAMSQRILCPASSNDFLTTKEGWLTCQNGTRTQSTTTYLESPRYIFNGRALAEFVHHDFAAQAFLWASLIIQSWGPRALNPGLPAHYTRSSSNFVNGGWPQITALLAEAAQAALQDAWFWKWRVYRRLRPEELAGRHALKTGGENFDGREFEKIGCLDAVEASRRKFGTAFLAQAYPEGSPMHPSFPAAHAEIAGACVTILKAFANPSFVVPSPVLPSQDGLDIVGYDGELCVEGELNKLAWNAAFGRSFAGIHYRSDDEVGLLLGEEIALKILSEEIEQIIGRKSTLWLRRFDGNWTSISAK
jgi:hypothetical protein